MFKRRKNLATTILQALFLALFLIIFSFNYVHASSFTAAKVIQLVNQSRETLGLPDLLENPVLSQVARDKAEDMIKNNYFSHTSPDGKDPWYWFVKDGYNYSYAGENLAINFPSAEAQHQAWMKSETHKKNILGGNYTEIGIAVAQGVINGKQSVVTVQVFGQPIINMAEVNQKNGAVETAQKDANLGFMNAKNNVFPKEYFDASAIKEDESKKVPEALGSQTKNEAVNDKINFINFGILASLFTIFLLTLASGTIIVFQNQYLAHYLNKTRSLAKKFDKITY